jgi:hypothetical protein
MRDLFVKDLSFSMVAKAFAKGDLGGLIGVSFSFKRGVPEIGASCFFF